MQCKTFQQQLPAYLDEALNEPERADWRRHLAECAECREWAVAQEPTLIFAGAAPAEAPSTARIEECVSAVSTLIHHDRLRHRLPSRSRRVRPWLAAAAAVIIIISGGLLWHQGTQPSTVTPMAELSEPDSTTLPPEIEVDMEGEGVRVYHFAATEDDSTATFIVNPALEL